MPRIIYKNAEDKVVPGVTTVLNNLGWNTRALMYWAWKLGWEQKDFRDEKSKAATIGTVGHKLIEIDVLHGTVVPEDIEALNVRYGKEIVDIAMTAYESWLRWRDSHKFTSLAAEESLVSPILNCGGTLDHRMAMAVAYVQDRRAILDVKVTKGLYPEHIIQVATYAFMRNELFPDEPIEELHWLKLGKDEPSFAHEWLPYESKAVAAAIQVFVHLRCIHDLKKRIKI